MIHGNFNVIKKNNAKESQSRKKEFRVVKMHSSYLIVLLVINDNCKQYSFKAKFV